MVKDKIVELLFPRRCIVCDEPVEAGKEPVCPSCREELRYVEEPFCMKCGKQLMEEQEYCEDCRNRKHAYIQGRSIFQYASVADAMFRFKNQGRREYADFLAWEMYRRTKEWLMTVRPDALVPVPVHKKRMKKRGYNQAAVLAERLFAYTGIPVLENWLVREGDTAPLKDLGAQERQNNLKKAFKIVRNDVKLNTIVIIDDIYTTGSTVDAIAQVIRQHSDCRVYVLTAAIGRGN